MKNGVAFSFAFFDRHPDGTCRPRGRWSDWVFPVGSLEVPPGRLDELIHPAMSVDGMIAMVANSVHSVAGELAGAGFRRRVVVFVGW